MLFFVKYTFVLGSDSIDHPKMYSYSKPGHFTWTATLKQCGSLTNGGKQEDESLQCSECTSSPAVGKSMLCVKKAHTGACTSKCLVLLAHSGILLPLNNF